MAACGTGSVVSEQCFCRECNVDSSWFHYNVKFTLFPRQQVFARKMVGNVLLHFALVGDFVDESFSSNLASNCFSLSAFLCICANLLGRSITPLV